MEFPKRTDEHIKETTSWRLLEAHAPREWIIRDVTERDYGIDAYIEIVSPKGEVSGELCSIQLKSTESIKWKDDSSILGRKAHLAGIKKSTVNYWMHLPVPVFLILADITEGRVFYIPVKEQVREQYAIYSNDSQKSLGFDFHEKFELGEHLGDFLFMMLYLKEKSFPQFSNYLRGLLIHWEDYYEFIIQNQGLDEFLEVEHERQLKLAHIYSSLLFLHNFFGIEWKVIDLDTLYKEDKDTWKGTYTQLHEMSLAKVLKQLQPIFFQTLKKAKVFVTEKQADYWMATDLILFEMCLNLNLDKLEEIS